MSSQNKTIAILGLGKVGTAFGYLLKRAGYNVVAASRSSSALKKELPYTVGKLFLDYTEAATNAKFIFITTPDDVIENVCKKITEAGAIKEGKSVLHMSGAAGLKILNSARNAGAYIASIHPLQSFADIDGAIKSIPGSTFGVTADEEIKNWCVKVVQDVGGIPLIIQEKDKSLYHAGACIASNYLTALIHTVLEIYQSFGLEAKDALSAIWPLIGGTLRNIESAGTISALTGPIARGDIGTIKNHLDAFQNKFPNLIPLYCEIGLITVEMGKAKKSLSDKKAEAIKELLKGAY